MNVTRIEYFYIDGYEFNQIGRGMLKCTNQLNYKTSPSRQGDFTMTTLNQYDSGVVPQVEIGFMLIPIDLFHKLRKILLTKRSFLVVYFDVDFGRYVVHEMYAHPDELKDFLNRGTDIIGLQNFKLTLTGTLKGKDRVLDETYNKNLSKGIVAGILEGINNLDYATYSVDFGGNTKQIKWGRSIPVPTGKWKEKDGKLKIDDDTNIFLNGGDRLNVYEKYTFIQV